MWIDEYILSIENTLDNYANWIGTTNEQIDVVWLTPSCLAVSLLGYATKSKPDAFLHHVARCLFVVCLFEFISLFFIVIAHEMHLFERSVSVIAHASILFVDEKFVYAARKKPPPNRVNLQISHNGSEVQ